MSPVVVIIDDTNANHGQSERERVCVGETVKREDVGTFFAPLLRASRHALHPVCAASHISSKSILSSFILMPPSFLSSSCFVMQALLNTAEPLCRSEESPSFSSCSIRTMRERKACRETDVREGERAMPRESAYVDPGVTRITRVF